MKVGATALAQDPEAMRLKRKEQEEAGIQPFSVMLAGAEEAQQRLDAEVLDRQQAHGAEPRVGRQRFTVAEGQETPAEPVAERAPQQAAETTFAHAAGPMTSGSRVNGELAGEDATSATAMPVWSQRMQRVMSDNASDQDAPDLQEAEREALEVESETAVEAGQMSEVSDDAWEEAEVAADHAVKVVDDRTVRLEIEQGEVSLELQLNEASVDIDVEVGGEDAEGAFQDLEHELAEGLANERKALGRYSVRRRVDVPNSQVTPRGRGGRLVSRLA